VKLTQELIEHIRGEGFSMLRYRLLADGKPTAVEHQKETTGRPHYKITRYAFVDMSAPDDPGAVFDVMRSRDGLLEWLEDRISRSAAASPGAGGTA